MRIILDTNVIVAAARSGRGASAAIMAMVGSTAFELNLSVAMALEYEEVLKRDADKIALTPVEVDELVAFLCAQARRCELPAGSWPLANDPDDEFVARLAVSSDSDYLVTHNVRHFRQLASVGIKVVTPSQFVAIMKERNESTDRPTS